MDEQQRRFYRAITEMEKEGDVESLDPALEDRLVRKTLQDLGAQRARRRWVSVGGVVAVAACLAAVLLLRSPEEELPPHTLQVSEGQLLSGAPLAQAAGLKIGRDAVLDLDVRPQDEVKGETLALAFVQKEGRLHPWPITTRRMPNGVFRIRAAASELQGISPGPAELIVGIGRPKSPPSLSEIEQALRSQPVPRIRTWQLLQRPFELTAP